MNPQMPIEAQLEMSMYSDIALNELDMLALWGFTQQEITSLLWLWQWYQAGGSDRTNIVRHWEFLRMLVKSGELEL